MAKTKGVPFWTKKLDRQYSIFIRMRDALETTGTLTDAECITCKRKFPIKKMHCGHWITRGRKATRWEETNTHAQCVSCNTFYEGEKQMYQDELEQMYGQEEVDRLKKLQYTTAKFTVSDLEEKYDYYRDRVKKYEEQY